MCSAHTHSNWRLKAERNLTHEHTLYSVIWHIYRSAGYEMSSLKAFRNIFFAIYRISATSQTDDNCVCVCVCVQWWFGLVAGKVTRKVGENVRADCCTHTLSLSFFFSGTFLMVVPFNIVTLCCCCTYLLYKIDTIVSECVCVHNMSVCVCVCVHVSVCLTQPVHYHYNQLVCMYK